MFKRALLILTMVGGFAVADASEANARLFWHRPIAPVRRVAARVILPPYPIARRRVFVGPVYRAPIVYRTPVVYAPGVYVGPSVYVGY